MVVAASVDSVFSHAAFAAQLGGVSFPLLSDFHPKGAVADSFGMYLGDAGITARATVIIDAAGKVRHASVANGSRDMDALLAEVRNIDAAWDGPALSRPAPTAPGLPGSGVLYVRDNCMFSRWAMYARTNLHLEGELEVRNVSEDAAALADLEKVGGKGQVPALHVGDRVMYESADINSFLVERCNPL